MGLYDPSSSRCLLIASACLFGGPLRRLGRLNVQGMSKLAQDLQGGPLSSHYELSASGPMSWDVQDKYFDFSNTATVASLAQTRFHLTTVPGFGGSLLDG